MPSTSAVRFTTLRYVAGLETSCISRAGDDAGNCGPYADVPARTRNTPTYLRYYTHPTAGWTLLTPPPAHAPASHHRTYRSGWTFIADAGST